MTIAVVSSESDTGKMDPHCGRFPDVKGAHPDPMQLREVALNIACLFVFSFVFDFVVFC